MTRVVVHSTPGVMDLRSATTFGFNAKPRSTSPFGFFGTGLKMSFAILARLGIPVYVTTDHNVYTFYTEKTQFRDCEFDLVRMSRENRSQQPFLKEHRDLPYTTQLGKTWELWQVFRELHSNTMDEGGVTFVLADATELQPLGDQTLIVVESEEYAKICDNMHEIFLPGGLREMKANEQLQVLDAPASYIFYRGVRVLELKKPSRLTYNFLNDVELTEDRTAKDAWALEAYIRRFLATTENDAFATKAATADPDTFEGELNYDWVSAKPSEAFTRAVRGAGAATPAAARFVKSHEPRRRVPNPLEQHPRPWQVGAAGEIVDRYGEVVLQAVDLSDEELRYVVALLQRDLGEAEMEDWLDPEQDIPF